MITRFRYFSRSIGRENTSSSSSSGRPDDSLDDDESGSESTEIGSSVQKFENTPLWSKETKHRVKNKDVST